MRDSLAHILYIGKAKNLKKRVSSYFLNKVRPPKLNALLSLVSQIDYIPT
ncbi:MAG: DNA helicase UvrC, partial [Elusimicrobia bacterium]|nr:DNA helicase UvrC [Elusimicrobiota bacterium]